MDHDRRDLSRKRFESSMPRDASQVIPWLSSSYEGAGGKRVGRSAIDERTFLSVPFDVHVLYLYLVVLTTHHSPLRLS